MLVENWTVFLNTFFNVIQTALLVFGVFMLTRHMDRDRDRESAWRTLKDENERMHKQMMQRASSEESDLM